MSETYRAIEKDLIEHFQAPPGSLTPHTTVDQADLDSLAMLELVTILEERHGVTLIDRPDHPRGDATMQQVADWVDRVISAEDPSGRSHRPHALPAGRAGA
ncbi:acyl carrier protein [Streptomyces sp. DH12]|uniref:acyl carrier protein n=1 Tax=Streptomyces sp. DH12 TaxID=2857010 RepID=UPI001E296A19|nr:acyl carrier protein [Streptomyces sp. DH12]